MASQILSPWRVTEKKQGSDWISLGFADLLSQLQGASVRPLWWRIPALQILVLSGPISWFQLPANVDHRRQQWWPKFLGSYAHTGQPGWVFTSLELFPARHLGNKTRLEPVVDYISLCRLSFVKCPFNALKTGNLALNAHQFHLYWKLGFFVCFFVCLFCFCLCHLGDGFGFWFSTCCLFPNWYNCESMIRFCFSVGIL